MSLLNDVKRLAEPDPSAGGFCCDCGHDGGTHYPECWRLVMPQIITALAALDDVTYHLDHLARFTEDRVADCDMSLADAAVRRARAAMKGEAVTTVSRLTTVSP